MWRSFWRPTDRFSLQEFKFMIKELQEIEVVNRLNKGFVVDILGSIVEIVTYGDRHDPLIFEYFMENQILAQFLRILKISEDSSIEAQFLQYLSIMIQNLYSEHAIYYCFSNDLINNIILHPYEFDAGELAPYYMSFLRTVSVKLDKQTICLLVKVQDDAVISFPLYTEALKFARHEEKMIQIAVRALTLCIYNLSDDIIFKYITSPPISEYFFDVVRYLSEQCSKLDALVIANKDGYTYEMKKLLILETDKVLDDLYYCNDLLGVGQPHLSRLVTQNLLSFLVLPMLLLSQPLNPNIGSRMSPVTYLYVVSRLLQVVDKKDLHNSVAFALLYSQIVSSDEGSSTGNHSSESFPRDLYEIEDYRRVLTTLEFEREENNLDKHLLKYSSLISISGDSGLDSLPSRRDGIFSLIFSENHNIMLASLMFLLVLSESKDLDDVLSSMIGLAQKKFGAELMGSPISPLRALDGNIFARHMSQILTALLNFLLNQPPFSPLILWNAGWILRKLLSCQERKLTDHDFHLFSISYGISCENLLKEVNGCWFDFIPITLKNEWESCKRVLEESSQSKDPFFVLEPASHKHLPDGDVSSSLAWQRMFNIVKVFVLHHLLNSFILKGDFLENPLLNLRSSSMAMATRTRGGDVLSADFGTELNLESGVTCKIAFSKSKEREIYVIPVAKGISGKLFLAEKIHFHSRRGVIFATAPLAGSSPTIDENHPTWLHLQVRAYEPKLKENRDDMNLSNTSDEPVDGRWTLGFPDEEACKYAMSLILEEISKQRSFVGSILTPLLQTAKKS